MLFKGAFFFCIYHLWIVVRNIQHVLHALCVCVLWLTIELEWIGWVQSFYSTVLSALTLVQSVLNLMQFVGLHDPWNLNLALLTGTPDLGKLEAGKWPQLLRKRLRVCSLWELFQKGDVQNISCGTFVFFHAEFTPTSFVSTGDTMAALQLSHQSDDKEDKELRATRILKLLI